MTYDAWLGRESMFCVLIAAVGTAIDGDPRRLSGAAANGSIRSDRHLRRAHQFQHRLVISGNLNATYISIAYDLSAVLDDGDNLRILPIIGKGGGQNIRDVRFLRGVDIGITQSNLLSVFQRTNEIGPIDDKILYIARLFNEEMHVVVRAEFGITSVEQLAGKKVNFSDIGSGTQLSTRDIFERLGIKAIEVNMGQNDAFEALKKGEIAATVLIAGKPTGLHRRSSGPPTAIASCRCRSASRCRTTICRPTLTHDDYPNLIEAGACRRHASRSARC